LDTIIPITAGIIIWSLVFASLGWDIFFSRFYNGYKNSPDRNKPSVILLQKIILGPLMHILVLILCIGILAICGFKLPSGNTEKIPHISIVLSAIILVYAISKFLAKDSRRKKYLIEYTLGSIAAIIVAIISKFLL
jgi:phosphoglycerol transferase MdoB-like AlkP superfamily enzyme